MPLCARCAGIYAGFAVCLPLCLLALKTRGRAPTLFYHAAAAVSLGVFLADGAANTLGALDTPQALRFGTGALVGLFASPYLAFLLSTALEREGGRPVASSFDALVLAVTAALMSTLNVRPAAWFLWLESWAAAGGLLLFLVVIHSVLIVVVFRRRAPVAAGIALFTVVAQLAVFSILRSLTGF